MPLRNWSEMLEEASKSAPTEYKLLDPGTYDLAIEKAEYRPAKSGKDGYNVHAKVETGPYQGQRVFQTFYVSPENPTALSIFFRQMNVLGLDKSFWAADPTDDQICAALTGKRFRGTVKKTSYQGKDRNEISDVATPGPAPQGAGGPPLPGAPNPGPVSTPTPPQPVAPSPAPAQAPQAAQAAPAVPASPWDSAPAAPAANDPWAAAPPPVPPVSGA